jgi:hypothetical protein
LTRQKGIIGPETGQLSVLAATTRIDGDGPAFSNEPHWAPNASSVLFSFETGAAVVDANGERLRDLTSLMEDSGQGWSHAVGWLGSKCVVYIAGKNQKDANQRPARVLNLRTNAAMSASQLLGVADSSLVGLIAFSPEIWIRTEGNKIMAESRARAWEIPVHHTGNVIAKLVPHDGSADLGVPDSCR